MLFILCVELLNIRIRNDPDIRAFTVLDIAIPLLAYADDVNIYIEWHEQSLRKCIEVMNAFYKLSGLEVNLTKTCCTYIGGPYNPREHRLCPDIQMSWVTSFKLLGITFDNLHLNVSDNYDLRIKDILDELRNWEYRLISPMGRLVVVKSLGLSKITNVASTLPTISMASIDKLENKLFEFIWTKHKTKIKKTEAKLPYYKGGLNFPDIRSSWMSFKFSWIRKILDCTNRDAPWYTLLNAQLTRSNGRLRLDNMSTWSVEDWRFASNKVNMDFWKEVFKITADFIDKQGLKNITDFTFSQPWGHTCFTDGGIINKSHVKLSHNDTVLFRDLVKEGTQDRVIPKTVFELSLILKRATYSQLTRVYNATVKALQGRFVGNYILDWIGPHYSLIDRLAHWTIKGCSEWANFFKTERLGDEVMRAKEKKWDARLNLTLEPQMWETCYKQTSTINFDNKLLVWQAQINRHVLRTNNSVSHHQHISPNCNFCLHVEDTYHALWECRRIAPFIRSLEHHFSDKWLDGLGQINRLEYIFNLKGTNTPRGILIMMAKKYVWKCRNSRDPLSVLVFKKFIKSYIDPYLDARVNRRWEFINNPVYMNSLA